MGLGCLRITWPRGIALSHHGSTKKASEERRGVSVEAVIPKEPESLDETGLTPSTVEQLILKILYFRGEVYGQELSTAIGLKFSVIQDVVEALKIAHHIQVKRSMGMGSVGSSFSLTESGRGRVRE